MTRRQIREHIFKLLYNLDFYLDQEGEGDSQVELYFEPLDEETLREAQGYDDAAAGEASDAGDSSAAGQWYRIRFEKAEDDEIPEYAGEEEKRYISGKVKAIAGNLPEIDEKIGTYAKGWKVNRMPRADLALLRLAVYEMLYDEEIPYKVAINEAVELSKLYGNEQSSSFINGVLSKLA